MVVAGSNGPSGRQMSTWGGGKRCGRGLGIRVERVENRRERAEAATED